MSTAPRRPPSWAPSAWARAMERRWALAMERPFLSQEPMVGPPPRGLSDLERPCLRKSTFGPEAIFWGKRLGGGLDGYTWKVWIHDKPFAIKVFYDTDPLEYGYHYHAVQRECQNVAVLQAIEAAMAHSAPIQLGANPRSRHDALNNLYAFSDEGYAAPPSDTCSELTSLAQMPRFRKCFGWLRIGGDVLCSLPSWLSAPLARISKIDRRISSDQEYLALIYEYIDEGPNEKMAVEKVANFLWMAGFGYTISPLAANWKSSVLIDLSDIVYAGGYGWNPHSYGPRTAEQWLIE